MGKSRIVICIKDRSGKQSWLDFSTPVEVVSVFETEKVMAGISRVEESVNSGLYAAGFLSYEAAPAFDSSFVVREARPGLPLLWFAICEGYRESNEPPHSEVDEYSNGDWEPEITREEYNERIKQIKEYIAAGDTYQVNFTFGLKSIFKGNPYGLFLDVYRRQRQGYFAYMEDEAFAVCSASPELFFHLKGNELEMRPMKGTAPRGKTPVEDEKLSAELYNSEKNRAENLMILDMTRNDLGRISEIGSVRVSHLYDIEKYDSLFQMTSTVRSVSNAGIAEIFEALFPCASITGAPKTRTMEIISELEAGPRGIYTGCTGYIAPEREAQFNVSIRTLHFDRKNGIVHYGTGGGIVWDSVDDDEYEECLVKTKVITEKHEDFKLLESLLWTPNERYFLLYRHLKRMKDSGEYFNFPVNAQQIERRLKELEKSFESRNYRVRLLVSADGKITLQSAPLDVPEVGGKVRICLADKPVDKDDRFLYHKTTNRKVYEDAAKSRTDCDDVILWNRDGEITETCIANLVFEMDGEYFTPPVSCGLLAGTYRAYLMGLGKIQERVIRKDEIGRYEKIYLINSVRKWREAKIV